MRAGADSLNVNQQTEAGRMPYQKEKGLFLSPKCELLRPCGKYRLPETRRRTLDVP